MIPLTRRLRADNPRRRVRHIALNGVDVEARAGEVVGLLGRNGAGKTTFASIVTGLVNPDAGSVLVDNVDALRHAHTVRPVIGFAPQTTGVYEVLTVKENLTLFCELAGIRGAKLRQRISEVLSALLLEDLSSRPSAALRRRKASSAYGTRADGKTAAPSSG
jgi:ABC-2 type transport system ATP-binding protein